MPKYLIFSVFVLQIKIFDCQTKIFAITVTSYQHYDVKIVESIVTAMLVTSMFGDINVDCVNGDKIDMLVTNFHQYAKMSLTIWFCHQKHVSWCLSPKYFNFDTVREQ